MHESFDKTLKDMDIRRLSQDDIPAAMQLKERAGWNQSSRDWRRLLEAEPEGCFAASFGDRLVATTTITTYGKTLAWIGMVLVDGEYRRLGIATRLMRRALGYLQVREIQTVKLDATPAGRTVYEGLGFVGEGLIERWQVTAPSEAQGAGQVLKKEEVSHLLSFDAEAFGANRAQLLQALIADACVQPLIVLAPNGALRGYGLAREGAQAYYLGPLVAMDARVAALLLDGLLAQLGGQEVYLDLNTAFAGGAQILADRGFIKQRDLIRMRSGQAASAGTSSRVLAIAGPEIG
jgi:ribosomal protein S18 acetylase RimI-like enzyme